MIMTYNKSNIPELGTWVAIDGRAVNLKQVVGGGVGREGGSQHAEKWCRWQIDELLQTKGVLFTHCRSRIVNLHRNWSNALCGWLRWQTFGVSWLHCAVSLLRLWRHHRCFKQATLTEFRDHLSPFCAEGSLKQNPWWERDEASGSRMI